MIVSDKVYRYERIEGKNTLGGKGFVLEQESAIPFNDFNYATDNYYGIEFEIKHAILMTDKTTISHFLKINPHLEAKLDIVRCAEACLRLITHSHLDRQEFFNWLLTQMTPEEVKLSLTI